MTGGRDLHAAVFAAIALACACQCRATPVQGLIGQPVSATLRSALFTSYGLQPTTYSSCDTGQIVGYRPSEQSAHRLVAVELIADKRAIVTDIIIVVDRDLTNSPENIVYARKFSADFLQEFSGFDPNGHVYNLAQEIKENEPILRFELDAGLPRVRIRRPLSQCYQVFLNQRSVCFIAEPADRNIEALFVFSGKNFGKPVLRMTFLGRDETPMSSGCKMDRISY